MNVPASLEFERAVTLDGHAGRQFRLKVGDAAGTARVFETRKHFYVVFTLKSAGGDEMVTRFNDSFTLDKSADIVIGQVVCDARASGMH